MRWFRALHDKLGAGTYDASLERDLQAAAGELAEVVGWLAYDAAQHDLCRRMNQESLYFTRLAGDTAVELLTLQNASMHAGAQGPPAGGAADREFGPGGPVPAVSPFEGAVPHPQGACPGAGRGRGRAADAA